MGYIIFIFTMDVLRYPENLDGKPETPVTSSQSASGKYFEPLLPVRPRLFAPTHRAYSQPGRQASKASGWHWQQWQQPAASE